MTRPARFVSIVVPTYNERQNLPRLVEAVAKHMRTEYEIVVVDDSSPDGTGELALDLAKEHPIRLVSRPAKSGLGSAYRDGFKVAKGDIIFQMDADLSHDPRYLPALIEAIENGADLAVGSRYSGNGRIVGWNWYRRLVSGTGNTLARLVLGLRSRDNTTGYRAYAREAADIVQMVQSDGYASMVEALHHARRSGLRVVEVPITFENRTVGKSKLGPSEFVRFVHTLVRLRFRPVARKGRVPARAP
jgi:dolichol-phosphate mannosyltransferase